LIRNCSDSVYTQLEYIIMLKECDSLSKTTGINIRFLFMHYIIPIMLILV